MHVAWQISSNSNSFYANGILETFKIISNIFLNLFCSSVQEHRRHEAGVSRSEELPQSMKISERVTTTATRSDTKLYKARERADGLK